MQLNQPYAYIPGNRYRALNRLGRGGMGVVFEAEDRLNGRIVALKRLHLPEAQLDDSWGHTKDTGRVTLAREFQTLAGLKHPNIIRVLDYGFDEDQQPFFTMELLSDADDILTYAADKDLDEKINLLIQLLQSLVYMHQRGFVHRDLKPGNILVDQDGHLRILDFGLAVQTSHAREIAGSLAYMAPEVLREEPATSASDLYAVGVIGYHIFTGEHPYGSAIGSMHTLVLALMDTIANIEPVAKIAGENLAYIIGMLLEKDPELRYSDAREVIQEMCQVTGRPLPEESDAIRDSFLQTAPFIGRQDTMRKLQQALVKTRDGEGSAWLIAGESGVGKTRLLSEMRIRAMVEGMQVITVKATPDNDPFSLWRQVLRHLLLVLPVQRREAGILKHVISDIETLIEQKVGAMPMLIGKSASQRLLATILNVITRIEHPVVLLLDDLHHASDEVTLLRRISQTLNRLPLLMVGTYRNDDAPYFYGKLPEMTPITIGRFNARELRVLSQSILGEAGVQGNVLDFLEQNTEGNPYYAIETLRSLAKDTGRLYEVGQMTMFPEQVLAPGVLEITRRRLSEIPVDYQPMLRVAAVAGRVVDFALLMEIDEELDYIEWLEVCIDAGIFDYVNDQWQFTHEKMREGVLYGLRQGEIPRLQQMIAEARLNLNRDSDDNLLPD